MVNWEFDNRLEDVTPGKMGIVLVFIIVTASLAWLSINTTLNIATVASAYMPIMLIALLILVMDFITERAKGENIFSTAFWEEDNFFTENTTRIKLLVLLVAVAVAIMIFFFVITAKTSIIGTPQHLFQAAELGTTGDIWITIAASMSENALFFYALMPTLYGVLFFLLRGHIGDGGAGAMAFILMVMFASPTVFTLYHYAVYGSALTPLISVWMFGFVNSVMVFILRTPIFTEFFHAANNLAVVIGRVTKVGFFVASGGS